MRRRIPLGVTLWLAVATAGTADAQDPITFADHIAPIVHEHCAGCHRPGSIGPFSLLDFDDVASRAELVADVVERGAMPPWKPVTGYGEFEGTRGLTSGDIALIRRWVDTGAREGGTAPPVPAFDDDWPLGQPDLVVATGQPYTVMAGSGDHHRNFVVPVPLDETRWVRGIALHPSSGSVVHHARLMLDASGGARDADTEDAEPGYPGLMLDHAAFPSGHFLVWAPERHRDLGPEATAWELRPGTDLVIQLHLRGRDQPVTVQPQVGLYFAERPPAFSATSIILNSRTIDIPAGTASHVVEDRFRLPVAVDLVGIAPHAHALGRQVESSATLPDGRDVPLLRIDDWDPDWQDEYRYVEPIRLPEGTVVSMRITFDNSSDNPRNPNVPPARVVYGPTAGDEMAEVALQVVPTDVGSQQRLMQTLSLKSARDDMLTYQARLRADPEDYESMSALAARYLDIGQVELAIEQLETAIAVAPDHAEAYYNLGSARVAQGDTAAAIAAYRRAIEIRPTYSAAHNNMGGLLESTGETIDAIAYYRLAIRHDPQNQTAHFNLGRALQERMEYEEAITHYQRAIEIGDGDAVTFNNLGRIYMALARHEEAIDYFLQSLGLDPNLAGSLIDLAFLRASAPRPEQRSAPEALALAQRAGTVIGADHPLVLDALAAAYAADGRFEQAVETGTRAAAQARATAGYEQMAPGMDARVGLYLSFRPFRMEPGP